MSVCVCGSSLTAISIDDPTSSIDYWALRTERSMNKLHAGLALRQELSALLDQSQGVQKQLDNAHAQRIGRPLSLITMGQQ